MTTASPDTALCPLCGFSNQCSLADPRTVDQPCWCFSQSIDPALLAALPDNLRDKACLCPRCAGIKDAAPNPQARRTTE
ncbi:cysteine-rich CWC family protein [Pseudomonas syringae]|uniref:cysteine-rich CWC family protein n=1 Tax=Pseudomonas TaxID=286 RepID=UPI000CD049D0|nr:cysteine-rich CWC family protein [Pseudomonas syringae]MCF5027842.1 helicase [Pseudomonas syringae]UQB19117.1 cysteine-rich CWC family protein [Pseudomonas syringae pv. syringae]